MSAPHSQTAVKHLQDAPELSREEIVARLIALAQHKHPYALSPVENAMWRQACWQGAALLSQSSGPAEDARDAARWRFCEEYGFPLSGPQWSAFIDNRTAYMGSSPGEAVDRAIAGLSATEDGGHK